MSIRREAMYVRRRRVALALAAMLALVLFLLVDRVLLGAGRAGAAPRSAQHTPTATAPGSGTPTSASSVSPSSPVPTTGAAAPSSPTPSSKPSGEPRQARGGAAGGTLVQGVRISGARTAASLAAAPTGGVFAQAAGDRHSVTAYLPDATVAGTVSDTVDLARFGIKGHPGLSLGAPQAAAFTHDGSAAYISNASMTGNGFAGDTKDLCSAKGPASGSYLYRVDAQNLSIDKVLPVQARPSHLAVTPDGAQVLTTSSCSGDLSVVDARSGRQVASIPLGKATTGLAVSADSRSAYVASSGSDVVRRVDLRTRKVADLARTGSGPRDLQLSRDGSHLFVANDGSRTVAQLDLRTGKVTGTVSVGMRPRALALSSDGTALYVAGSGKTVLSKLATSDLTVLQRVHTASAAVDVVYEPARKRVWLACAGGDILVFDDAHQAKSTSSAP